MNHEDYCSYELSILLKEKGYNIPTYTAYIQDEKVDSLIWIEHYDSQHNFNNEPPVERIISAPTLWEAQKWLREEKSIDIDISTYRFINYVDDIITREYEFEIAYKDDEYSQDGYYKTYEEALSNALTEALELL